MKYFPALIAILIFHTFFSNVNAQKSAKFEILDKTIIDVKFYASGTKFIIVKASLIESWDVFNKMKEFTIGNNSNSGNQCVDISVNGKYIIAGTKNGSIILWNLESKRLVWEVNTGDLITDVKFAPDNSSIVAGSSNSKIYKLNFEDGEIINEFNNHKKDITSLEFCRNGNYLMSSSADKSIIVWNYQKGEIKTQLIEHKDWIRDIAINKDETRMISCDDDGYLFFWNIQNINSINLLNKEKVSRKWLTSVSYYKDGSTYISSDLSGKVLIFTNIDLKKKFRKPVIKTEIIPNESDNLEVMVLFHNDGIKFYDIKSLY